MPIPANPLLSEIVLEGIKQAGEFNPSVSLVTRATDIWIEQIKNDIWHLAKKPKILHVTAYTVANQGQSKYAYPSDYSSDLSLTILHGTDQGVSQGGDINQLILESTDASGPNIIGKEVLMLSGVSEGSYSQIVTYDSGTKTCGVVPDFNVAPVSGDRYMIIDVEYPVITKPIWEFEQKQKITTPMRPRFAYPVGDDQSGYFIFDSPPDMGYGVRIRYYADLSQIDSDSTLMSVLYRRWRNIWIDGVRAKKLQDEDDDRAPAAQQQYKQGLMALIYREIYGMDISNITDRVTDYY